MVGDDLGSAEGNKATWTIPIERLKNAKAAKQPFVVPLSARAVRDREEMPTTTSPYVFSGSRQPAAQPNGVLHFASTHGFRPRRPRFPQCISRHAGDQTPIAREVCEAALGHVIGGVEAAYRRSDALGKRRELMDMWSAYCGATPPALPAGGYDAGAAGTAADNVVPFTRAS